MADEVLKYGDALRNLDQARAAERTFGEAITRQILQMDQTCRRLGGMAGEVQSDEREELFADLLRRATSICNDTGAQLENTSARHRAEEEYHRAWNVYFQA